MKEFYYYFRDKDRHPRITVCLIENGSCYHRGISLCSFSEKELSKERGRRTARSRAIRAMYTFSNSSPALRKESHEVLKACNVPFGLFVPYEEFKSMYKVELTPFEQKLVDYGKEKSV